MKLPAKYDSYLLPATQGFLLSNWRRSSMISALLVLPCLWQRRIEACDLGSHVYNVWLTQLVRQGKAPGLWVASQWSNTLFDRLLGASINAFGFALGEKLAVIGCVLIFFWGLFALASAASARAAWLVVPVIAAFSYGWVFSMGLMNLYLSMGFLFFLLAIVWRGRGWELALSLPLLLVISMAHIMGAAAALALGVFLGFIRLVPGRFFQLGLAVFSVLLVLVGREYAARHYILYPAKESLGWMAGTDQLFLYGHQYWYVSVALLIAAIAFIIAGIARQGLNASPGSASWLTLFVTLVVTCSVLPPGLYSAANGPIGFLPERASAFCAAMLCCVLAIFVRRAWQSVLLSVVVAAFFVLYYQDTTRLNGAEKRIENVVKTLPKGTRIVTGIRELDSPECRVLSGHLLDRACVGSCFSYANYEVSSRQFRLKGNPGNGIVTTSFVDSILLENGSYVPKSYDPPIIELVRCQSESGLCVQPYSH
jgi:hypothetical protein